MSGDGVVIVVPAVGERAEVARLLLRLADDPRQVRTVGNGTQFEVPAALADAFHQEISGKRSPARSKRGRPPRAKEQ